MPPLARTGTEHSPRWRGCLLVAGIVQLGMAIATLFLWMQRKNEDSELSRPLGICAAITGIVAGFVAVATGVGSVAAIQEFRNFCAVISGIVSVLAATVQAIADDGQEEDTSPVVIHHLLVLLPFLCFFICTLEVLAYLALRKREQYQSISEESGIGNAAEGLTNQDAISRQARIPFRSSRNGPRPPAYSSPPPYTERSPLSGSQAGIRGNPSARI